MIESASEQLLRTTRELASFLDELPIGILMANSDGKVVYASKGYRLIVGAEETDTPYPSDKTALSQALRGVAAKTSDGEVLLADGSRIAIRSSAVPLLDAQGQIYGAISVIEDATRQRDTELEQARNYRLMFQSNPRPMWVYDYETLRFLEVNDAAIGHYGYSRQEFLDMSITDIRPAEDRAELLEHLRNSKSIDVSGPWRQLRRDGSMIEVKITSHEVEFGGRNARVAMVEDVTDQQKLERKMQRSERLESLGQLAAGVAHDFNNLLAVIINNAKFVASEIDDKELALKDLQQIVGASERAAALTQQLLIFGRRQAVRAELVDLNAIVTGIQSMLATTLGANIELKSVAALNLPTVKADPAQLEQALVNLAVNARDAMANGGTLTVETSVVQIGPDQKGEIEPGEYVCLSVTDTGAGMDEATVAHAFEPFFTTKGLAEGTGLGLATVYGVVTAAGGTITIYSEPDVGTAVHVYLPAYRERPQPTPGAATADLVVGDGEVVLVVDDEEGLREVAARILRKHGYVVVEAAGWEDALKAFDLQHCDLLLTDVVMPQVSGPELIRRVREKHPNVKAVLMSGYSPARVDEMNSESDAPLIKKPFDDAALLDAVHRALKAGS